MEIGKDPMALFHSMLELIVMENFIHNITYLVSGIIDYHTLNVLG